MTAPYSKEKKIEILTYAKEHGVAAAARHYGIARQQITYWNKQLHIYTPQTTEYPISMRQQVVSYAKIAGVRAAAKKFGVSVAIITLWNQQMHAFAPKRTTFTEEQKIEILEVARDIGPAMAANKFGINIGTLCQWNKKYKIYETQKRYNITEIITILTFAKNYGVTAATEEFNISKETINRWNETHKIYTPQDMPSYVEYTPTEQQEILNAAREIYDAMPSDTRSANQAFIYMSGKYDVTVDQLWAWNRKFKIVPSRHRRQQQITQDEIAVVQRTLNTSRGRIAATARKTGVSVSRITKLKKEKKVTFDKGTQKIKTNPPVGQKKAKIIGAIIGGLLNKKERE